MSYLIKTGYLAFIFVVLGISFCASEKTQSGVENQTMQNISIDSVKVTEMIPDKGRIVVSIKGFLPNPAYEIQKIKVTIDKNKIQITPHVFHDPNKVVIQMTIPFEKKVVVSGLKEKKKYEIKVANKVYINKFMLQPK